MPDNNEGPLPLYLRLARVLITGAQYRSPGLDTRGRNCVIHVVCIVCMLGSVCVGFSVMT